jgi:hypothetical protein
MEAANPPIKASEAYGKHEGAYMKPIFYDRMRVDLSKGKKGGPGFSGIQLVDPNYADAKAAAGVTDQKMATRILNRNKAGVPAGAKVIWTPSVGGLEQHKSNSTMFGEFADIFANQRKNMSAEEIQKLSDRASTMTDNKGRLIFPNGIDLGSRNFRQQVKTYDQRGLMADIFAGRGVGGEKGRTVPMEELLEKNVDPNVAKAGTLDLGNRLFRLEGDVIDRPDLHSDYRKILTGEDLGVNYLPVPIKDVYSDWEVQKALDLAAQGKNRGVTLMDYTKNDPTVQLTDALLTKMQKAGQKKGGAVSREESPEDMARFQKRFAMHKAVGGVVSKKMASGGRASIFDAPKMAGGGRASIFDKPVHMVDGGKVAKGLMGAIEKASTAADAAMALPKVDRLSMNYKDVTKRVPEVADAVDKLLKGEITKAQYNDIVNTYKPVTPYSFVPKPATKDEAVGALRGDAAKERYGKQAEYEPGSKIGLRLDIPAYTGKGVWVNSIHDEKGKKVAYGPVASVKNADLGISQNESKRIALGGAKAPYARIKGDWNPISEEEAIAKAQEYLNHPEWKQIGMDPERHSYFYDRRTMQPITNAEEIIQIGPLVLGKNPKYGSIDDFEYADGGKVASKLANAFKKASNAADAAMSGSKALPAAERDANLAKFLEPSKAKERLYHGTGQGDISEFKSPSSKKVPPGYMWGQKGDETYNRGVFLSPDPEMANHFAKRGTKLAEDDAGQYAVYPVRAQIERPFDYENPEHREMLAQFFQKQYDEWHKGNPEAKRMPDVSMEHLLDNPGINFQAIESPEMLHAIEKLGFDSFYTSEGKAKNIGVFDPRKIKSDVGNRGTYDITDPDINKADGGKIVRGGLSAMNKASKMADEKLAAQAIGKAAESAGMKAPVTANKPLTTVQDFHTSFGDSVRKRAADMQAMMDSFDYKYDKGQRVFTEDSARKNWPPMTVLGRVLEGNRIMREDPSDFLSKKIIDEATGKAKRTPHEPGYKVRLEHSPDNWSEFVIPESAIKGNVDMARGGLAMADGGDPSKRLSGNIMAGASWNSLNKTLGNELTTLTGQPTINTSVGGATTADTYKQLMDFINGGGSFDPNATVFLQTGGVDFITGVPREEVKNNIEQIISVLGDQGVNVVLTGAPYAASMDDVINNNFDPRIDPIFEEIAAAHPNVALVDSMGDILQDKSLLSDSLHTNETGTRRYNDDVIGALTALQQRQEQTQGGREAATSVPQEIERITQPNIEQETTRQVADPIKQEFKEAITQEETQEPADVKVEVQDPVEQVAVEQVASPSAPDYSRAYDALGGADVVNGLRDQLLGMGIDESIIAESFLKYYPKEYEQEFAQEMYKHGGLTMAEGGSSNYHPDVQEALKAGRITPNQAKWMSNYYRTPGNPEIGTAGINDGISEKMMNYRNAVRAGEYTRPNWMEPIPKEVKLPKWFDGKVDLDREGLRQLDKIPGMTKKAFNASEYSNTFPVGTNDVNYYNELLKASKETPDYQPYIEEMNKLKGRNPDLGKAKGGRIEESPEDMARFHKRFVMHKALGGAVKKPQKFDGGGIAAADVGSNTEDKGPTKAGLMTEFLAQMAKDQAKEEYESYKKPRAATDIGNRGILAPAIGAPVDLINMGLMAADYIGSKATGKPIRLSSEKPFGGSEHLKDLMDKYGVTSGEDRPLTETMLSLFSPTGMIKGATGMTKGAVKAADAMRKPRAGAMREKTN